MMSDEPAASTHEGQVERVIPNALENPIVLRRSRSTFAIHAVSHGDTGPGLQLRESEWHATIERCCSRLAMSRRNSVAAGANRGH